MKKMKKIYSFLAVALVVLTANAQTVDRSIRPAAAPARAVEIQDAKIFTLPNGMKVFVVEDHRTPVVYYSLALDIKPALEGEKAGMHELFSEVFGTVTKNRSKEQLNKELDLIAAIGGASSRGAYLSFLKKYEQKALELMADMLFHPVFLESELALGKEKFKSALSTVNDSPSEINNRVSAALTYGKNFPDGELETLLSIENTTLKDLEDYYVNYFSPDVARLVIVGDITEAEAKKNVRKYFSNWKKRTVTEAKYTLPEAPVATAVAIVDKPGAPQSSINISYPVAFKPGAADADAAAVMSHILGGGAGGRLFQNLREKHSYTYGVYCSLEADELIGRFYLTAGGGSAASVKAAATDSAISEVFYEMHRMINEPVSEEELQAAKAYMAGSFGRSLEEASTIAQFATYIDKYDLPKDYFKNYLKRLEAVTVADVQAAAVKYLKPNNAWVVVTADKSHAEQLKQFAANGEVQFYDNEANPIEAPVVQQTDISAAQVIEAYVEALGGLQAIEAVTDYRITEEMNMMGQTLTTIKAFKQPHYTLEIVEMGGMLMQKQVFDGTKVKITGMGGEQELTEGEEFEAAKALAAVCPERHYIKNGYVLTVKGIDKVNGNDAYALEVRKGESVKMEYYDVQSGLKVKTAETADTPQGPIQAVVEYADYRNVNGVLFPYKTKQLAAGMAMESEVKALEVNAGIDINVFQ
jgi:predicted Zn-dependent peptidase